MVSSVEQHRRAELEAQMKAREEAKKKQRADQLQEDLKVHRESAMYDPWGKGGGGAPHRSPAGQPISDLHQVRRVAGWCPVPHRLTTSCVCVLLMPTLPNI